MKGNRFFFILLFAISMICLNGCREDDNTTSQKEQQIERRRICEPEDEDLIDAELPDYMSDCSERTNPYTISNMRVALNLIREELDNPCGLPNTLNISDIAFSITLQPTEYYIIVYPELVSDYETLLDDFMIVSAPHPLLLENVDGLYGNEVTYLYDVQEEVPALYCTGKESLLEELEANGIYYNVIDSLFIPEHSDDLSAYAQWINNSELPEWEMNNLTRDQRDFAKAITYMAFRVAGYETNDIGPLEETECETKYFLWWSWSDCDTYHHPTGQIKIETPQGWTGVSGIQIRLFRWFTTHDIYTDGSGQYYDERRWEKLWLTDEIFYTIRTKGHRLSNNNYWNLRTSIAGAIPLWTYEYLCGFHSSFGYSVKIAPSSGGLWGRCVLNNAIYDYCVYTEQENLSLPPSNLNIATSNANNNDWTSSCPLLQNHINVSLLNFPIIGVFLELIYLLASPYPILPDMLLKYSTDIADYNKIIYTAWHELTHSSHLRQTTTSNGFSSASIYWSNVVSYEAQKYVENGSPYGSIGDYNWEQIALVEGWANYREWYMGNLYLGCNNYEDYYFGHASLVAYHYAAYFKSLYNHGITMREMERALGNAYTLIQFKNNLLSICPSKSAIINTYIP